MKILREGKWTKAVTCLGCTSRLLVEEDDVRFGTFGQDYLGHGGEDLFYCICLRCNSTIFLKLDWVPHFLQVQAQVAAGMEITSPDEHDDAQAEDNQD